MKMVAGCPCTPRLMCSTEGGYNGTFSPRACGVPRQNHSLQILKAPDNVECNQLSRLAPSPREPAEFDGKLTASKNSKAPNLECYQLIRQVDCLVRGALEHLYFYHCGLAALCQLIVPGCHRGHLN